MISKYLSPKNDFAFKKIFGSETHKDILIHFLNDILCLKGPHSIQNVNFLSPNMNPDIWSKKQSIVDVMCEDQKGVRFIVEMQVAKNPGFEKRAQYYAAKAYGDQLKSGGNYHTLKEIIFLAIADFIVFPEKKEYKSDHVILDKLSFEHDLKDFSFTFIELPKFKKQKGAPLDSIIEKWCYFFKYADETTPQELKQLIGSDLIIQEAYEALDQFNWSDEERRTYDAILKIEKDNWSIEQYKLQEAAETMAKELAKAREKGTKEGIEQAIEQGIEQGKKIQATQLAKALLQENFSPEKVSKLTSLTLEEIKHLLNKDL
jgi:predicted transposase/invertase (TIGR01784 family)